MELDEDGDDAVPVLGFRHRKLRRNVLHEELQQEKVALEVERSVDELMMFRYGDLVVRIVALREVMGWNPATTSVFH